MHSARKRKAITTAATLPLDVDLEVIDLPMACEHVYPFFRNQGGQVTLLGTWERRGGGQRVACKLCGRLAGYLPSPTRVDGGRAKDYHK